MAENITMGEHIAGSLLGLACGDALGAPLEFMPQAEAQRRFGLVTEMIGGKQWAPGEWTDDTAMALNADDVDELLDLGVSHYLDLRAPDEAILKGAEAIEVMGGRGITPESAPIVDISAPTLDILEQAVRFLDETLAQPGNVVYVSCRAGLERTGAVLAAHHACSHRVGYDEALAAVQVGRPGLKPLPWQKQAVCRFLKDRGIS